MKKKRRLKNSIFIVLAIFTAAVIGCGVYVGDYYRIGKSAVQALETDEIVVTEKIADDIYAFVPENPVSGLIFYPGGKVEYTAYAPLMESYAKRGVLCVLVKMPFNLAVLDVDAADGIQEQFPEIENWYIGGHSLGGSMAANYVSEHVNEFDGLLLLASYATADLSQSGLNIISVYGSEDKVLNLEKYEEYHENLPTDAKEMVIKGGCHALFGDYGAQEGDGEPTITAEEQINATIEFSIESGMKMR